MASKKRAQLPTVESIEAAEKALAAGYTAVELLLMDVMSLVRRGPGWDDEIELDVDFERIAHLWNLVDTVGEEVGSLQGLHRDLASEVRSLMSDFVTTPRFRAELAASREEALGV
jgi:hypothetical protein